MRKILMMLDMKKKYQMPMKVMIFIIPKNGMKKLINKLQQLKINSKLRQRKKMKENLLREKLNKNKRNENKFLSNNLNKRNIMKLLWLMVTNTQVKLIHRFMDFSKMKSMLEHKTIKFINTIQTIGTAKSKNRPMKLGNKWLKKTNKKSIMNKWLKPMYTHKQLI